MPCWLVPESAPFTGASFGLFSVRWSDTFSEPRHLATCIPLVFTAGLLFYLSLHE